MSQLPPFPKPTVYDLSAPAKVIVPLGAPLVNLLNRRYDTHPQATTLTVSTTNVPEDAVPEYGENAHARRIAEMLYALILVEQAHIDFACFDWVQTHFPGRHHMGQLDADIQSSLAEHVTLLIAHDYSGTMEHDKITVAISLFVDIH